MSKKHNFTLAEILITIGIIGVIAAITIPNLVHKIQAQILKTQFKNSTAKLTQAIKRAKYELDVDTLATYCKYYNGSYVNAMTCINAVQNAYNTKGAKWEKKFYMEKYDVDRTGQMKNFTGSKKLTYLDSSHAPLFYQNRMMDGSYLGAGVANYTLIFTVDVNGSGKPNKLGHDIFILYVESSKDTLTGYKWDGKYYTDEQINNLNYSYFEEYFKSKHGNPCYKSSNQMYNGIGCGWYALHDICPTTGKPGYFECLP